ncbi:hypothetical protein EDB81DRAFT_761363 [Dactylonectria macrodidyma]|uniref:Uncharacterized protein n=1 Tax=Dactylonectria macrodidyma TaxID=307937 RepID=A0A9P9EK05_9HYPO|nr:hypothetical protein EDB81DRAFT_761363 [Dactylonectria macrodidyma]
MSHVLHRDADTAKPARDEHAARESRAPEYKAGNRESRDETEHIQGPVRVVRTSRACFAELRLELRLEIPSIDRVSQRPWANSHRHSSPRHVVPEGGKKAKPEVLLLRGLVRLGADGPPNEAGNERCPLKQTGVNDKFPLGPAMEKVERGRTGSRPRPRTPRGRWMSADMLDPHLTDRQTDQPTNQLINKSPAGNQNVRVAGTVDTAAIGRPGIYHRGYHELVDLLSGNIPPIRGRATAGMLYNPRGLWSGQAANLPTTVLPPFTPPPSLSLQSPFF